MSVSKPQLDLTHKPRAPFANPIIFLSRLLGDLPVFTIDQLRFIGRENLTYMVNMRKDTLKDIQLTFNMIRERAELLNGKTVADIQQLASQYDHPNYRTNTFYYHPDVVNTKDPKARKRTPNTTTFNICGWCQYAIEIPTWLMNEEYDEEKTYFSLSQCSYLEDEWCQDPKNNFNHPCTLTHCTDAQLRDIYLNLQAQCDYYQSQCDEIQYHIDFLQDLITQAESKPPFPMWRSPYAAGTLLYHLGEDHSYEDPRPPCPPRFNNGGYYSTNRYILSRGIVLNDKHSIIFQPDTGAEPTNISFNYHYPGYFSFEELTYLLEHPDYAQIWLASCGYRYSGLCGLFAAYQENHCLPSSVLV